MSQKRKRLNLVLPLGEYIRLASYAEKTGRTITDVLRELIRSLPDS
jgi:predicted DNA-binding protein